MKLKDQVAIVTGAGRNIGEEISKLLAQNVTFCTHRAIKNASQ